MEQFAPLALVAAAALLCALGAKRDLQAPLALTIASFAATGAATTLAFGAQYAHLAALVLTCGMIAETDRRHHLIPDLMTAAALVLSFAMPFGDDSATRAIGAVSLGGTFLIIRQAMGAGRDADVLGWGDVKFATVIGAALGPIYGFGAVAIAGAATLATVAVVRAKDGVAIAGVPFGVGLASATALVAVARALLP